MINIKTPEEIELIKESGKITAFILRKILAKAKPGVKGIDLENLTGSLLDKFGVRASFKTVKKYPFAICFSLNEEVVHGLPGERKLKEGDLLSIDFGVLRKGWHSDMARTIVVGNGKWEMGNGKFRHLRGGRMDFSEVNRFLRVGREALQKAIKQAKVGNRVGHISLAIQKTIESAGYNVVKSLTGHGVGKKLHEDPQIPCFLPGSIEKTPLLKKGMVLAVEVMYAQGRGEVKTKGWTMVAKDGSLTGHFENTIAITKQGPVILTK